MNESNMFAELGQCGFHTNSFGYRQNLILVHDKEKNIIWCKDRIPKGNRIYIGVKNAESEYIGTVVESKLVEKSVGNIHEIELIYEIDETHPIHQANVELAKAIGEDFTREMEQ